MMSEAVTGCDPLKPVFLALTAEEEFWDTSHEMVFLGEWCRRYSRRQVWEPCNGITVIHPWSDRSRFRKDYRYIESIYERVLDQLTQVMNDMHGMSNGKRYWRIVIGPWAMLYVGVLFERYLSIRSAIDTLPSFTTFGLDEESFQTPENTADFINCIISDRYNLQLYTKILKALGHTPPCKKLQPTKKMESNGSGSLARKLTKASIAAVNHVLVRFSPVILHNSFFNRKTGLLLALRTGFKVWPMDGYAAYPTQTLYNQGLRNKIQCQWNESEFERLLSSCIPDDIPTCFIENFSAVANAAKRNYPAHPKAILSACSWYFDEPYKQWSAVSAEQGTLLAGTQHGGNYGSTPYLMYESHELMICNRYYTWGWELPDTPCPLKKMSATKLPHGQIGADNTKSGILFASTAFPRYFVRPPVTIPQMVHYYGLQNCFIDALEPHHRSSTTVRLYNTDYGWDRAEQWLTMYPEVQLDNSDGVPFYTRLQECRLYVCDHLATTFVEALAADKPTILFWNPDENELTPSAVPYYEMLVSAGILYYSADEAATAVNRVYDDVEGWWNEPQRKKTRAVFCDRFARTSPRTLEDWADELMKLAC